MRRVGGLLAGLALCAAGCGSQDHDSTSGLGAVTPPPVTAPAITDSAALQAKLLTVADLPPGYTQLDDGSPGNGGGAAQDHSRTDPAACGKVLAAVTDQVPGASAHGTVNYSTPDFASIDIDAASYPGNGAGQAFSSVQQLLRQCTSYSGTDADGIAVDYKVSGLDQPRTGDASTAFQVHTSSQGMSLYSAAALVLVGSTVVQVAETSPQPVDPGALHNLVAAQVGRLQGVLGP
ncbi:hypothetical protein BJY24_006859 [Nocardia transvalensis]|uniref:PknH-like protein n=1 Tax=Nocardia transvalensis TaxID=37333 RepID=A0A7W9PKM8_9NOCA|nr:sensor domain-containing protein [Nocardia transvalensis]MBB5917947.1 hypothetical protein [Nocardia transvalensis]